MCFRGIRKSPNSPELFTGPVSAPVNAVQQPDIAHGTRCVGNVRFNSRARPGEAENCVILEPHWSSQTEPVDLDKGGHPVSVCPYYYKFSLAAAKKDHGKDLKCSNVPITCRACFDAGLPNERRWKYNMWRHYSGQHNGMMLPAPEYVVSEKEAKGIYKQKLHMNDLGIRYIDDLPSQPASGDSRWLWNLLPPELQVPKVVVDEIANSASYLGT